MTPTQLLSLPAFAVWLGTPARVYRDVAPQGVKGIYCVYTLIDSGAIETSGRSQLARKVVAFELFDNSQAERYMSGLALDWGPITNFWNTLKSQDASLGYPYLAQLTEDGTGEVFLYGGATLEFAQSPTLNARTGVLFASIRAVLELWR